MGASLSLSCLLYRKSNLPVLSLFLSLVFGTLVTLPSLISHISSFTISIDLQRNTEDHARPGKPCNEREELGRDRV